MTGFFKRMRNFGFRRILLSFDFVIALILTFVILYTTRGNLILDDTIRSLLSDIINASITITTVILAGLAIVISFTNKDFVKLLERLKVYGNVIFVFEYTAFLSIFSFSVSIFLKYAYFNVWVFYVLCFFSIYMLLSLMNLISFIGYYGIRNTEFSNMKK
jgi:hypothetical protein